VGLGGRGILGLGLGLGSGLGWAGWRWAWSERLEARAWAQGWAGLGSGVGREARTATNRGRSWPWQRSSLAAAALARAPGGGAQQRRGWPIAPPHRFHTSRLELFSLTTCILHTPSISWLIRCGGRRRAAELAGCLLRAARGRGGGAAERGRRGGRPSSLGAAVHPAPTRSSPSLPWRSAAIRFVSPAWGPCCRRREIHTVCECGPRGGRRGPPGRQRTSVTSRRSRPSRSSNISLLDCACSAVRSDMPAAAAGAGEGSACDIVL
jgi:hypothetical protein